MDDERRGPDSAPPDPFEEHVTGALEAVSESGEPDGVREWDEAADESPAERTGEHPDGAGDLMSTMTDCALCLLHGATAGAPQAGGLLPLPFHTQALMPAVPTAPTLAPVWPGALLRAPPVTA